MKTCHFGQLSDKIKLCVASRMNHYGEQLQKNLDLSVNKCIDTCRATEQSSTHPKMMKDQEVIHAVSKPVNPRQRHNRTRHITSKMTVTLSEDVRAVKHQVYPNQLFTTMVVEEKRVTRPGFNMQRNQTARFDAQHIHRTNQVLSLYITRRKPHLLEYAA